VEQLRTNELLLVVSYAADDQSVGVSLFSLRQCIVLAISLRQFPSTSLTHEVVDGLCRLAFQQILVKHSSALKQCSTSLGNWADLSTGLISPPGMSIVVPISLASAVRIYASSGAFCAPRSCGPPRPPPLAVRVSAPNQLGSVTPNSREKTHTWV